MPSNQHTWRYRGHRLNQLEWGLWKDLDRQGYFFLCYRPQGRAGPVVRRWVYADGVRLKLEELQDHVRSVRARINAAKLAGGRLRIGADQALVEYVRELERLNRAASHVAGVKRSAERYLDHADISLLCQVGPRSIESWLQRLHQQGRNPRTLNKHRSHLAAWFNWATGRDYLAANPAEKVAKATRQEKLVAFPRPGEMAELVDASDPYDAALWTFLAFTGLRRGSFLSITPDRILEDGIVVDTKRRREWFLSYDDGCPLWRPDLSVLARRIWEERPPSVGYIQHHWRDIRKRAGHSFTLHGLRHGFCSWLAMMGETLHDIAAWAHHVNLSTTQRYAHLRPRGRDRIEENRQRVFTLRSHCLEKAGIGGT